MAKKPRDVPHYERPLPSQEEPFIELIMTLRAKNGELYRTLVKGLSRKPRHRAAYERLINPPNLKDLLPH
jgi:hypothetical protein